MHFLPSSFQTPEASLICCLCSQVTSGTLAPAARDGTGRDGIAEGPRPETSSRKARRSRLSRRDIRAPPARGTWPEDAVEEVGSAERRRWRRRQCWWFWWCVQDWCRPAQHRNVSMTTMDVIHVLGTHRYLLGTCLECVRYILKKTSWDARISTLLTVYYRDHLPGSQWISQKSLAKFCIHVSFPFAFFFRMHSVSHSKIIAHSILLRSQCRLHY